MKDKKRHKDVSNSVVDRVIDFLYKNFPKSYSPKSVSKCIHCKESTVRKTLIRLASKKEKEKKIRRIRRGVYIANINSKNFHKLEYPKAKLHNITLQFEPIVTRKGGYPLALNTEWTKNGAHQNNINKIWNMGKYAYDVHFQINQNNTITVHLNASVNPISEIGFRDFYFWLKGFLIGLGFNDVHYRCEVKKAELNLDYRRITITPKMLTIADLLEASFLRIYQKYANLTRIEVGTTFEGEKAIYDLFLGLVNPALQYDKKEDDFIDVT